MQCFGVQAGNRRVSRQRRQRIHSRDAGRAKLEALALAHVRHQAEVTLLSQPLFDEVTPAPMITGHILRYHGRVEAFSESAIALAQQLVPSPELVGR
jgi:hypothetical protein